MRRVKPVKDEDYHFDLFVNASGPKVVARVTHLPTGLTGESDEDTSQFRARGQAMERLNVALAAVVRRKWAAQHKAKPDS